MLQRNPVFSFGGAVSFSSPPTQTASTRHRLFVFIFAHVIQSQSLDMRHRRPCTMAALAAADLCPALCFKKPPSIGICFGERDTLLSLDSMRPPPPVFLRRALSFRSFSSTPPPPSSSQSFPNFATISLSAPAPHVVTVTLNRPEKLNAMNKVTSASVQKCLPR